MPAHDMKTPWTVSWGLGFRVISYPEVRVLTGLGSRIIPGLRKPTLKGLAEEGVAPEPQSSANRRAAAKDTEEHGVRVRAESFEFVFLKYS